MTRPTKQATRVPSTIAVMICSYRRPDSLLRGLDALAAQERRPDEVLTVIREEDEATRVALASRPDDGLPIRVLTVNKPGTVHALNTGLAALRSDVVAITDDDTVPWPDWTARILAHFRDDPALGGLGGRDWMHEGGRVNDASATVVGKLQWFGRTIGNHHLGVGPARPVDLLKGANMSYRAEAIANLRFDTRLRGTGAQPAEDFTFAVAVKHSGWKLIYDPAIALDHYSGVRDEPRHYSGIVKTWNGDGLKDFAHNEVVCLWNAIDTKPRWLAYVVWSILVGTKVSPGLLQAILLTRQLGLTSWVRFMHIQRGKLSGLMTMLSSKGGTARPADIERQSPDPKCPAENDMSAALDPVYFVGIVNPVACGVRAYGEILASALRNNEMEVHENWIPSDMTTYRSVFRAAIAILGQAFKLPRHSIVVWHYAAYGYSLRGISTPSVLFGLLCWIRDIKIVTIVHEPGAELTHGQTLKYYFQYFSQYMALSFVVRSSSSVLVTTEPRAKKISSRFKIRTAVAPVFSNLPLAEPNSIEPLTSNGQRIGIFGFGAFNSRADVTLGGIEPFCNDGRTQIIMAGAPGKRSRQSEVWMNMAQKLGISDRISFTGVIPVSELAQSLATCDVVILPYDEGPNGRKGTLSGVLGLGCAVIALDGSDSWDELVRSKAVCVVQPSHTAVTNALTDLLKDSAERSALRHRARKFYDQYLSVEVTVQVLTDLMLN